MTVQTTTEPGHAAMLAGKYLTFALGHESYGIPVLKVREIIKRLPVTGVPQLPAYVQGVINLRGKIIPIVDLRTKFGLTPAEASARNCIVVVQVRTQPRTQIAMGLVVDGVEEVANIAPSEIEEPPDFGAVVDTAYILGMAKIKGAVKALLDIDRVLASPCLAAAGNIAGESN